MKDKNKILSLRDFSLSFGGQSVLDGFDLDIYLHEKLVLSGKSGIGKSSLIKALLGFTGSIEGELLFDGKLVDEQNIADFRAAVAWMPQGLDLSDEAVIDFLEMPFNFRQNQEQDLNRQLLHDLMDSFELEQKLLKKRLNQLSGGERQRFTLILCILLKRPLMMLDEPTASLDSGVRNKVVDYLFQLKNTSILFITHDTVIIERADRLIKI